MGIIRLLHRSTVAPSVGGATDGAFTPPTRHATIALRVGLPARPGARMPLRVEQMQPFETIYIDSMIAACNGGGGPLGHPKVYLNLAGSGEGECPYCSRLFLHKAREMHGAASHGVDSHGVGAYAGAGHGVETPAAAD